MNHYNLYYNTNNPLRERVYNAAVDCCRGNLRDFGGRRVLIEGGGYNGIWLETQPMGGEMFALYDLEAALNNQLLFMEAIRADGKIPSVICWDENTKKFNRMFSHFQGYCFPWHALNMYYLTGKKRDYLEQLYDVLERFDSYLWRTHDSDGDGCLESWCKWDTGEDNCSRFYDAPDAWGEDTPPPKKANSFVPYESMDVMSYSFDGRNTLAKIARILWPDDDRAERWERAAAAVAAKIKDYLWREDKGACYDRDCDNRFMETLIHNNLRCMYFGSFDQGMADRFIREHLLNPAEFFTPMPLPSIAVNDPLYLADANNNWSGQPQGLTYQRAIRALDNYSRLDLLPLFYEKLVHAVSHPSTSVSPTGGSPAGGSPAGGSPAGDSIRFAQQYDTLTGTPSPFGDGCYGPAALAVMEGTMRLYGIKLIGERIHFGTLGGEEYDCTLESDRGIYSLKCDGRIAEIMKDKKQLHRCDCDPLKPSVSFAFD